MPNILSVCVFFFSFLHPKDNQTEWRCSDCQFSTTNDFVQSSIALIEAEIDAVPDTNDVHQTIDSYEFLLTKYGRILHPNHFLQVKVKELLIILYAARMGEGDDFQSEVIKCMERRLDLCRNILDVLDVLQPGKNRSRAMLLYEMYTSTIAVIKLNWNSLIGRDEHVANTSVLLDECLPVLKWEDESSVERTVADICERLAESVLMMSLGEIPMH